MAREEWKKKRNKTKRISTNKNQPLKCKKTRLTLSGNEKRKGIVGQEEQTKILVIMVKVKHAKNMYSPSQNPKKY